MSLKESFNSFHPKILVHLGAAKLNHRFQKEALEYVRKAVKTGYEAAKSGLPAEDIVSSAISILEDCPVSDAGIGSVYNKKGGHQMDAGIMTGDKKYGAMISIHNIKNPIQAARLMLDDPRYSILSGEGAMEFLKQKKIPILPDSSFRTCFNTYIKDLLEKKKEDQKFDHGTVGCVAMDLNGKIAAGTSTGGTPNAPFGRVADSPLPGCGVWADDENACVSCTGVGEFIMVNLLAAKAAFKVNHLSAMEAAKEAIKDFSRIFPQKVDAGIILISKKTCEYGFAHNSPHMPIAFLNDDGSITSGLTCNDLHAES